MPRRMKGKRNRQKHAERIMTRRGAGLGLHNPATPRLAKPAGPRLRRRKAGLVRRTRLAFMNKNISAGGRR
jgi:hypothetical protein